MEHADFYPAALSIPLSVWSSRASLGRTFRRLGLFVIPEETDLPEELKFLNNDLEQQQARRKVLPLPDEAGFVAGGG